MRKREKRTKYQKWINSILNSLILVIVLAIGIVSYYTFFIGNYEEEKAIAKEQPIVKEKPVTEVSNDRSISQERLEWIRNKMDNRNVIETIFEEDWTSVSTSQKEPHEIKYDVGTQDWFEMKKCIAYATNLTLTDFVVQKIGRGEKLNQTVGLISTKDRIHHYKVYMEWVENEGWKPMLVQQLKELK